MTANMIGVRFRDASKIYHFAPPEEPIHEGEYVVVETARGLEMARVVTVPPEDAGPVPNDARPIVRLADATDRDTAQQMREKGDRMVERARVLISKHDLQMYVAAMQVNLAGSDATCYFQADGHVDFMPVVDDVESEFEVRLHMQQAGPRDRAKLVDGHDICGLRLCCSSWMTNFPKVGIRMAKEQSLALNPDKISGVCGRLLCCLTFEVDVYREMRGTLPKVGKRVSTPAGMGKVVQANVLKQTIMLELDDHAGRVEVPATEIGMAVRVEERPNAAIEDTLGEVLERAAGPGEDERDRDRGGRRRRRGRDRDGDRPQTSDEKPDAAPTGDAEGQERTGRRRRRRRRRGGGDSSESGSRPEAQSTTGADRSEDRRGPASGEGRRASDGGAQAEGEPRRRRRRRRRRGSGGGAREGSSGGGSAPADGGASRPPRGSHRPQRAPLRAIRRRRRPGESRHRSLRRRHLGATPRRR